MKVLVLHRQARTASALLVTMFTVVLLGILLASYLSLVGNQNRAVIRSQAWNAALHIAEAGIEEALLNLNANGSDNLNLTGSGWTNNGTARSLDGSPGTYYSVSVASGGGTITSTGRVQLPAGYSASRPWIQRIVQVTTVKPSRFPKGILAKGSINMNGNNVTVDSFDSADPRFSTNGFYWPGHFKTNGDVTTMLSVSNSSFSVGNANIYGMASTGPGGIVSVGAQGMVVNGITHDANFDIPDATVPFATAAPPGVGSYNGTNYQYYLGNGDYQWGGNFAPSGATVTVPVSTNTTTVLVTNVTSTGNRNSRTYTTNVTPQTSTSVVNNTVVQAALVNGKARFYVTGSLDLGSSFLLLANSNSSVEIYVGTGTLGLGGNGVVNQTGRATNLTIYGLSGVTGVSLSGNAQFTGGLYAPNADLSFNGGGNNTLDFTGALTVRSITLNGHFNVHYDEAWRNVSTPQRYVVNSWKEL